MRIEYEDEKKSVHLGEVRVGEVFRVVNYANLYMKIPTMPDPDSPYDNLTAVCLNNGVLFGFADKAEVVIVDGYFVAKGGK